MSEHMLTWDGLAMRIISGGFKLLSDERPLLAFPFDKVYYEPEAGNSFKIMPDNSRVQLTELEIEDVEDFCETFWQFNDFTVHAYSDSGLYEGAVQKSYAEENGLSYRVNEVPDHPASKWTGERWERVAITILDNGDVQEWPESICPHCVLGYTQEESAIIGQRPSVYHKWDIAHACWVDGRTLEEAKIEAASSIRVEFELVRHRMSTEKYYVPSYETETWTWQVLEARAWLADNASETPYIDAFLAARTDENVPTKQALCEDILTNNRAFLAAMAQVSGLLWGFLARVKNAVTNEECVALQEEAHEFCVAMRNSQEG